MTGGDSARKAKAQAAAPKGANRAVIGAVVAAVVVVGVVLAISVGTKGNDPQASAGRGANGTGSSANALPAGATGAGGGIVVNTKANAGAPTLDVYEDFQCPVCGRLEKLFGTQITSMATAGDITLVIHTLSFLDVNLKNDSSRRAANAAACAADAGRFGEYHAAVFAGQPEQEGTGYTDDQLKVFAHTAGITGAALTTWERCESSGQHNGYVRAVQTQGEKDGVFATPTLRLNGTVLDLKALTPQYLIDQAKAATK